ncbi:MAG: hypothetical protein FJ206_04345 [Gemmatimonadetes bacterium]|nr:hypothetical protein [Gemmatimonadota bacterium]
MTDALSRLLDLQTKDLALLETDVRLKAIADELAGLDAQIDSARRDLAVSTKRHEDAVKRRQDLELRIDGYRAIQDKRRQRLETVKGAREAQAVVTEVEMARAVLVREEAEWVKVAEGVHDCERAIKAVEDRIAALQAGQSAQRETLQAEIAELEAARSAAMAARDAAAVEVDRAIRARYDRLRSARSNAVVVALRGDACGACFTAVPRNRRTQIRAGVLLDNCEACGVILYAEVTDE